MTQETIRRIKWSNNELQKLRVALAELPVWPGDDSVEVINRVMIRALPPERRQRIKHHSTALRALALIRNVEDPTVPQPEASIIKMPGVVTVTEPAPAPVAPPTPAPVAVEMTRATLLAMLPLLPRGSLVQLMD